MADSSYTAIATVVTQACPAGAKGFWGELSLPRLDEEDPELAGKLNEMMQQVEDRFNLLNKSAPITVCIVNGAVIFDGSHGTNFEVEMTDGEDINSITFKNWVPGAFYSINFRNVGVDDQTISGWPTDAVCTGCGNALNPTVVPSGTNMRRGFRPNKNNVAVEADGVSGSEGGQPGGGGGGKGDSGSDALDDCICDTGDPLLNELTVKVCTEFDCEDSEPKLELEVCGGVPPYTWSKAGGEGVSVLEKIIAQI